MTQVYSAISAVQAEIAATGIGKHRRNQQQGYNFRGIDDVFNALAPILAKHKLVVVPRMLTRECVERTNAKGTALFYVTVDAEFDFVSADDGSKHTAKTFGEAMDSGDKATNKAMSAAYKYAAFLTFAIPTEGTPDADEQTQEVAQHVSEETRQKAVETIQASPDMEGLKKAFTQAYKLATALNDQDAMDVFNAAKNARKAELEAA